MTPAEAVDRADELADELLDGSGHVLIEGAYPVDQVAEARALIVEHSSNEDDRVTHFLGADADKLHLQRRLWNLLDRGEIFEEMAQHPAVLAIVALLLGRDFVMGSYCANRLMPGAPAQEPHIDYPYWDFHDEAAFPRNLNSSFTMNCQATVLLDDFTEENGATAFVPASYRQLVYPDDQPGFAARSVRMTGKAGDIALFNGMCWHAAQANGSDADRVGILIEYLPKFVVPLEDLAAGLGDEVKERATPVLRRLISLDAPYPTIMDEEAPGTAEGIRGASDR